jgi:hypothetical protein
MKLYAIKWQNEEIKEGAWFKSLGCAISAIGHFEGRVVEEVIRRDYPDTLLDYVGTTHAGKTGMALKLWWQRLQEETEARDKNEKAAIHARAIEIARASAKARPESYYSEPFQPHAWVIDAITIALTEGGAE